MQRLEGAEEALILVPSDADPLDVLAASLLRDFDEKLPDLSGAVVILPDRSGAIRLRRLLLERATAQGHPALLGPVVRTWGQWVDAIPLPGTVVLDEVEREVLLVGALRAHEGLLRGANPWALAEVLLGLFDELTLDRAGLPPDLEAFTARLARAYAIQKPTLEALQMESRLVHTLWHAWHQELEGRGRTDSAAAYLMRLARLGETGERLYVAGHRRTRRAESDALGRLLKGGRTRLFVQPPLYAHEASVEVTEETRPDGFARFISVALDGTGTLADRARGFAGECPASPATGRLAVFEAEGSEQEARAVETRVRAWLLEGRRQIGVVTENRKLARRVRALLERAGVLLQDASGWTLSTTSAAACLERWLECVEEDFPHDALLDLLKSPFMEDAEEDRKALAYRLEQDIVIHENVGRGLERYLRHIRFRQRRLPTDLAASLDPVATLLAELGRAAAPLRALLDEEAAPERYMAVLRETLDDIGLTRTFAADAAGCQLLETLERMGAVRGTGTAIRWGEFRGWLGRNLERAHFRPSGGAGAVMLMGLGQSRVHCFDALVLAGAEREHLPGSPAASPFFNDAVRRELGLTAAESLQRDRFWDFRRLLEGNAQVLITFRARENDEEVPPSPWVERLRAFHRLAYRDGLEDRQLRAWVHDDATQIHRGDAPLPRPPSRPEVAALSELLPDTVSASAYQQLMDCPYKFFAARCLRLAPSEAVREALEKSDYGQRVHRCLEAFHGGVEGLPGPFTGPITAGNLDAARAMLESISAQVFARDVEDNFLHRGWLERWRAFIPLYLAWELEREKEWHPERMEVRSRRDDLVGGMTLVGRLDRIDRRNDECAIVDYKTGYTPSADDVLEAEAVQLPFYAATAEEGEAVTRVEYLSVDGKRAESACVMEGEELESLRLAVVERLDRAMNAIRQGAAIPAWGDETTCERCPMDGICRRQLWAGDETATPAATRS